MRMVLEDTVAVWVEPVGTIVIDWNTRANA
jgi:hypothetical protein